MVRAMLTDLDLQRLDFERTWWKHPGAKHSEILARFGESPTRYYQALNALIDNPAALAHDPLLVKRLQRLREQRATQRRRAIH